MAIPKKINLTNIRKLSYMDEVTATDAEKRAAIPQMQELIRKQAKLVKTKGSYSHALERAIGKDYDDTDYTSVDPTKLNRYEISHLFAKLRSALQGKTATTAGAKKFAEETDMRLFGTHIDTEGKKVANRRMSIDESRAFWKFYDEFLNIYGSTYLAKYEKVQQVMAQEIVKSSEVYGPPIGYELPEGYDYEDMELMEYIKNKIDNYQSQNLTEAPEIIGGIFRSRRNSNEE